MSLELLESWRTLLGDLAAVGDVLCGAIEADDVLGAISAMAQLRRTRAALAAVEAPVRLRGDRDELRAMAEVSALTINARVAEAAMQRWLDRELPGDARLLASPLGAAVLADAMLPAVWDFEGDLAVLIGPGLQPVADMLGALGQRRIVILGGDPPAAGGGAAGEAVGGGAAVAPDDITALPAPIHVASLDEAAIACHTMFPGPPIRLAVRAAVSADPAAVEEAAHRLRDVLSDLRIHRNTVRAFSRAWVEQGAANLPAITRWPSVAAVGDRFTGIPMVIVAPGPSLARNIDQLRDLRGRAILTAFSHSLRPVVAAGLTPDLVVTVDPQDVRYHFAGCDVSRSCLVNAATVHPSLFDLPAQRFLTLSANSAIDDWMFSGLGEDAMIPSGGSVATTAFSLALAWGCDPIVFVGLDLSFPGGQYYVASSTDGGARAEIDERGVMRVAGWSDGFHAMKAAGGPAAASERVVELPGWAGGTVPSSFMFSMFHRWFVDCMREVRGVSVFNCTEGGAYIKGMDHRPLAEILARLDRTIDVAGELDAAAMTVDGTRTDRMIEHLTGFARRLRRGRWLARAARTLIARGHTGARLTTLEHALAATLRSLTIVSLLAQREVDRAHDIARRPGVETDFLAASASLLGTLIDVADQLEPLLRTALDRLGPRRSRGRAA